MSSTEINILDFNRTGIKPLNKLETFMLIEGTKHYYISSEGRLANDIKGKFYVHMKHCQKQQIKFTGRYIMKMKAAWNIKEMYMQII